MRQSIRVPLIMATMAILAVSGVIAGTKYSSVGSGWIGASIQTVDSDLADAFELPVSYGVLINRVIKDGPAQKAGLRRDDIVIAFNGDKISDDEMLRELIAHSDAGDKVTFTVMRGDDKKEIEVVLEERDDEDANFWGWNNNFPPSGFFSGPARKYSGSFRDHATKLPYLGVKMSDLTEQLGDFFGVRDGDGVLITEVIKDSPAEKAGLKAGDVIVQIGEARIENSSDVSELISDREVGDEVELGLLRDKRSVTLKATLGETDGLFFGNFAPFDNDIIDLSGLGALGQLGNLRALQFGTPGPLNSFDDDLKSDMKQLKRELQELQQEIKELRDFRK